MTASALTDVVSIDNLPAVQVVTGSVGINGTPLTTISAVIPHVSVGNSTTVLLGANATFSGSSDDVSTFISTDVTILADVTGTLLFQWSQDNVTFDYTEQFNILANSGSFYSLAPRAKFFRTTYTNGAMPQGAFALSTVHYPVARSVYVQNLDTDVPAQKATDVIRAVIAAQRQIAGGDVNYTNLQATNSGSLRVSVDNLPAVQSVTGLVFSGTVDTAPSPSPSHTTLNLAASLASQVALGNNPNRRGVSLFNAQTSRGTCYLSLGTTASTGSYVVAMRPGSYFSFDTVPAEAISFVFDQVPGNVMVTEQA